jgi:2-keto-4-pentenoate hydratase
VPQASNLRAAELLAEARFQKLPLKELPSEVRPGTPDEAYLVRELVVEQWLGRYGGQVIGYKIACTNPTAQQYLNLDGPFYGNLLSSLTFESPAHLKAGDFSMRVIEAEFAFRMGRGLPAADHTSDQIRASIEGVIPGIEIVDSSYTSWTTAGAAALIADNACHGAWVKGPLVKNWRKIDLETQQVQLMVNGKLVATGTGAAVLGHPLNAVEWLVRKLASHGKGLNAGDYITTGVTTDTYMASKGDRVRADFGPVGAVDLSFE